MNTIHTVVRTARGDLYIDVLPREDTSTCGLCPSGLPVRHHVNVRQGDVTRRVEACADCTAWFLFLMTGTRAEVHAGRIHSLSLPVQGGAL